MLSMPCWVMRVRPLSSGMLRLSHDHRPPFRRVFVLRRREPNAPRPYRARGHPWTTGFVLAGSVAFLGSAVVSDTTNSLWALGLVVVSYPAFRMLLAGRERKPATP